MARRELSIEAHESLKSPFNFNLRLVVRPPRVIPNILFFIFSVTKTYISPDTFNIIRTPQWIYNNNNLWADGESLSIKHTVRVTPHVRATDQRLQPIYEFMNAFASSANPLLTWAMGCRQLQIDGIDSTLLSSTARLHSADATTGSTPHFCFWFLIKFYCCFHSFEHAAILTWNREGWGLQFLRNGCTVWIPVRNSSYYVFDCKRDILENRSLIWFPFRHVVRSNISLRSIPSIKSGYRRSQLFNPIVFTSIMHMMSAGYGWMCRHLLLLEAELCSVHSQLFQTLIHLMPFYVR